MDSVDSTWIKCYCDIAMAMQIRACNMDSIRFYDCFSFVVGALAVMVGYNIFGLKNDLKNEIEEKLQDISDHHVIHTAKTMMYIEIRLLHMAMKLKNIADIRQSIYMMLETTEKTKDKEDIDYVINQLKELKTRYGYTLFDDAFTRKLKIKLGRIGTFSDSALLFLQDLEV